MIRSTTISVMYRFLFKGILLLACLILARCNHKAGNSNIHLISSERGSLKHSQRLRLDKNDTCTIVTIMDPWQGASKVRQTYFLVQKGKELKFPAGKKWNVIEVPVRNLICTSTTHLAMISALNEERSVSGFSGTKYIFDKKLLELVKSGQIKNVGEESGLNYEAIIGLNPDLIILYGVDSEYSGYEDRFNGSGINAMFNADFLEEDPLGKAEWIKLFGSLFCKEELADSLYSEIENSYSETKRFIEKNLVTRPAVLLGLPFRDTWYVSPGNSYAAQLIADAGGNYLWSDTKSSVTMPLSLENVYTRSLDADFWLNIGSVRTSSEIKNFDGRLSSIPCFMNGKMFNNNKRVSDTGGNDYWESGIMNPHIILQDIATILHPELFPDHQLRYYLRIR